MKIPRIGDIVRIRNSYSNVDTPHWGVQPSILKYLANCGNLIVDGIILENPPYVNVRPENDHPSSQAYFTIPVQVLEGQSI